MLSPDCLDEILMLFVISFLGLGLRGWPCCWGKFVLQQTLGKLGKRKQLFFHNNLTQSVKVFERFAQNNLVRINVMSSFNSWLATQCFQRYTSKPLNSKLRQEFKLFSCWCGRKGTCWMEMTISSVSFSISVMLNKLTETEDAFFWGRDLCVITLSSHYIYITLFFSTARGNPKAL